MFRYFKTAQKLADYAKARTTMRVMPLFSTEDMDNYCLKKRGTAVRSYSRALHRTVPTPALCHTALYPTALYPSTVPHSA